MTLPGFGDMSSKSISIGTDDWTDSQGTGMWVHRSVDRSASDSADMFTSLADAGLVLVDPASAGAQPDLPGSGCVIAFSSKGAPAASPAPGGLDLANVTTVFFRISSDGKVESAAFVFDPAQAATGASPAEFTLVFDYATPVSITAPDPATVTEESPAP